MAAQQPVADDDVRSAVIGNVRAEMARRRVSHTAAAAAIGVTQPALSMKLRGVRPLRIEELIALADFLDVPIRVLLDDDHEASA